MEGLLYTHQLKKVKELTGLSTLELNGILAIIEPMIINNLEAARDNEYHDSMGHNI